MSRYDSPASRAEAAERIRIAVSAREQTRVLRAGMPVTFWNWGRGRSAATPNASKQ